jgi:hypothetical protein
VSTPALLSLFALFVCRSHSQLSGSLFFYLLALGEPTMTKATYEAMTAFEGTTTGTERKYTGSHSHSTS